MTKEERTCKRKASEVIDLEEVEEEPEESGESEDEAKAQDVTNAIRCIDEILYGVLQSSTREDECEFAFNKLADVFKSNHTPLV